MRHHREELQLAAMKGNLRGMRKAPRDGANVNAKDEGDGSGDTAFHAACRYERLKAVEFLSNVPGIDLNAVNGKFQTPFMVACSEGKTSKWSNL